VSCPAPTQSPRLNARNKAAAARDYAYGPAPMGTVGAGWHPARIVGVVGRVAGRWRGLRILAPSLSSSEARAYWTAKAAAKRITLEQATRELCGNCKAYDVSPAMQACGGAGGEAIAVVCAQTGRPRMTLPRGYCQMHNFTCSALRSCSTWVGGGPRVSDSR